ncbi:transcription factor GTE9 [Lactuca sativa]|uniref:Bromo domain-containing protein n=1 Tax=Lactuca sativa TaxID=4236 RepID=A0A9R1UXR6_LACSA|nr:transcription factor GTE9 [Lactuca sativa]XP_023732895.1 transcription factor GTE9 [Lactuca sativa]KAJ0195493.1 hypothetical protein LSAT_V11C700353220 [Lactuca sativa]
MVKILLPGSKKRQDPPEISEGQQQKKQKLDHGVKIECLKILKTLMTHKFGSVFNQPVDPVELGIPDYFEIISHPMDLGTIHNKLEDNIYSFPESFANDIRLTFSNAMRYNPPKNSVHLMAKEMNDLFIKIWKSVEPKLRKPSKNGGEKVKICKPVKKQGVHVSVGVKVKKSEDIISKASSCSEGKTLMTYEEKMRIKKELMVALRGEITGPLRGFLRKYGLIYSRKEKIESVFNSFGDDTLMELKRSLKGSLCLSLEKAKDDCVKPQWTKEATERQKLEEKSNIESRIRAARAAKEAILESAKSDLQMKRDKERERVEKMERTVTMDDNLTVLRELEKLCEISGIKNPLEKLGLRLKEEYYYGYEYIDDDDDDDDELEDGEIF